MFLRQLTAQRVHSFLHKEKAVSARFWTEDLSRVRQTWWPLHYRNLQPGLSLSFQSWILVNFTTYGAWPPVTYLTYLTGPTQAFRGQCINKSLFKFTVIYLCKTYSSTLRRTWWPLHYRNLQPWLRLSFPSHASWNAKQTTDCVALFNLQIPSIFSRKQKKNPVFCWKSQDFHFYINYRFSDGLRPSWPQSLCSVEFLLNRKLIEHLWKIERLFPPSFEQGTFRVLGKHDNHYTTETFCLEASRNI